MQLAIPIFIVLVALVVAYLARRHHRVRNWFLSVRTALLGGVLFAAAAISAFVISLRLPVFGAMALLGAILFSTTLAQHYVDDKARIWARGLNAIHFVSKWAFLVVFCTFLLALTFSTVGRSIKGD